jgi:Flp pilus assembly pilin Flp
MVLDVVTKRLSELHREESGDIPVGPLLLIGLIVIPMVIGLIAFGDAVMEWLSDQWSEVSGADTDGMEFQP